MQECINRPSCSCVTHSSVTTFPAQDLWHYRKHLGLKGFYVKPRTNLMTTEQWHQRPSVYRPMGIHSCPLFPVNTLTHILQNILTLEDSGWAGYVFDVETPDKPIKLTDLLKLLHSLCFIGSSANTTLVPPISKSTVWSFFSYSCIGKGYSGLLAHWW